MLNDYIAVSEYFFEEEYFHFHRSSDTKKSVSELGYVSHTHRFYEIIQILEGKIRAVIDGKIYNATIGDVILIRPDDFHVIDILSPTYKRRVIEFLPKSLNMTQEATSSLLKPFRSGHTRFNNCISREIIEESEFNSIFDSLEDTLTQNISNTVKKLTISVKMGNILLCLHNLINKNDDYDEVATSPVCTAVINYINKHIGERIRLEDLEKALNLSKFYLSHEFKNQMGMNISTYIVEKKMIYADQLIESGTSPTEASYAVGYNYPNFYTNYKKIFGKTPKQSKKRN